MSICTQVQPSSEELRGLINSSTGQSKSYPYDFFASHQLTFCLRNHNMPMIGWSVHFPVHQYILELGSNAFNGFWCLRYERFVVALEEASRDMLPALKNKALKVVFLFIFYFPCVWNLKIRELIWFRFCVWNVINSKWFNFLNIKLIFKSNQFHLVHFNSNQFYFLIVSKHKVHNSGHIY